MAFTTGFHWGSPADQPSGDPARFVDVCRRAATAGFESVEVPVTRSVAAGLSLATTTAGAFDDLRFRLTCPTPALLGALLADEKSKDACAALEGRLILHVRMDEDADASDGGVTEAGTVLASVRRLFSGSARLELNVEGQSAEAAWLAILHAERLWRQPARPAMVDGDASPVLHFGTQVGLVASLVARETRCEALDAASVLFDHAVDFASDSTSWTAPCVWVGGGDTPGVRTAVLIGSFDELAEAIRRYARGGVSSFLIRGCGVRDVDEREMAIFGSEVLPRVQRLE
jgi:hypothetical protein